jgi:hypothetical protein
MPKRVNDSPNRDDAELVAPLLARIGQLVTRLSARDERIDELLAQVKTANAPASRASWPRSPTRRGASGCRHAQYRIASACGGASHLGFRTLTFLHRSFSQHDRTWPEAVERPKEDTNTSAHGRRSSWDASTMAPAEALRQHHVCDPPAVALGDTQNASCRNDTIFRPK